ncbi:MAG: protein TolQ [Rickettsiales bacterium]|nr:protein TolQ [Rickettsiales bacterium]
MPETAVTPVQATELAGTVSHDTSFLSLFINADPIILLIMLLLIGMSIVSWGIIFEKIMTFRNLQYKTDKFEQEFWQADALDQFHERVKKRRSHPMASVFLTAMEEWFRSKNSPRSGGGSVTKYDLQISLKDRIGQMMSVTRNRELDKLERGLSFLATAGSASPFIGLLGTVIGIMNSFRAIAGSQNTSLVVVAPGIAEALFVTGIGLFVAIPAVIAYNKFTNELSRFAGRMDDFSTEFNTLISRQIDNGGA